MIQVLSRREGFTTDDSCVRSKNLLGVCVTKTFLAATAALEVRMLVCLSVSQSL